MLRHYYFPRPYPDELIGSLILRACRHRGVSAKIMSLWLSGRYRSYWPLAISAELLPIARAAGMDAYELLWRHTVFPYVTAFMSEPKTNLLARHLIEGQGDSIAMLVRAATIGHLGQRYCSACLADDWEQFGEVYWHREHNLPVVVICRKHNLPLQVRTNPDARRRHYVLKLPKKEAARAQKSLLAPDWAEAVNDLVHDLMNRRGRWSPADWGRHYHDMASSKGLAPKGSGLSGRGFSNAFHKAFGSAFLTAVGLNFPRDTEAWPALMLHENHQTTFTASKHVLLQVFLHSSVSVDAVANYRTTGPAPRDYAALDARCWKALRKAIGALRADERVGVAQLLKDLNVWSIYRHNSAWLPKTKEVLTRFRRTNNALCQLGGRPRKYK